jgi:hypothetical protein
MTRSRLWLIPFSILLWACGSDNPIGSQQLVGAYSIQRVTVETFGLEASLTPPEVTGFLTLTANNRNSLGIQSAEAELDENDAGTYTISGSTITLASDADPEDTVVGEVRSGGSEIQIVESFDDEGIPVTLTVVFQK